uniref:hypothetical protein n=1 Tax=Vibrio anguillarum TaxID=55601 RepID=UPI0012FD3390|nr:hypothetical protein [Vibrio anguillarum]
MSDVLKNLISSLDKLQDVFTTEEVDGADFLSQYGWEHSAIDKNDLVAYIDNFAARLVAVESSTLDAKTLKRFEHFTEQIETLTKNSEEHFINTESYIRVIVPNIIITLNVIFAYIEDALFGWDYINLSIKFEVQRSAIISNKTFLWCLKAQTSSGSVVKLVRNRVALCLSERRH